jgi:hypothetical protein
MRDSLLAASGELDLRTGGKPESLFGAEATLRRSLYGKIDRTFLPSTLRDFDFANPELHNPQRHQTNVPQRALFFMNSPFVEARAIAFARRVETESPGAGTEDRIRRFFQIACQRNPANTELEASRQFIAEAMASASGSEVKTPRATKPAPWRYGYGEFDEVNGALKEFHPLPHFTGDAWGGGQDWPDAALGWVRLTAVGGHTGNDLQHAAVRRWIAPVTGKISLTGSIRVTDGCGDGIRAIVISDRRGVLGKWEVQFGEAAQADVADLEVAEGEIIDFVVDCRPAGNFSCDQFLWAPTIRQQSLGEWSAEREFAGEVTGPARQLNPWERFAQALLLTNSFMFID